MSRAGQGVEYVEVVNAVTKLHHLAERPVNGAPLRYTACGYQADGFVFATEQGKLCQFCEVQVSAARAFGGSRGG
jgi:hypothetical protein